MKKFFKVFILCLICILLVGCNKDNKDNNNEKENEIALYTDDSKLVYDNNGIFKVVFYHENNKVTKVEHYYEYADNESAKKEYEKFLVEYKSNISINSIKLNDKYVIFDVDITPYSNKTIEEIQETYSYFTPVYKK